MKRFLTITLLIFTLPIAAQQGQHLFMMHYVGESNFMNPAVQSECEWFIGLPLLSSLHVNYGNNAASIDQLLVSEGEQLTTREFDRLINRLGRRTFIGTELHVNLLALGYKRNDYYFNFSIIEKNNLPLTISKDIFRLAWRGNTQFEGDEASTMGTSVYFNHYREYALGISKHLGQGAYLGIKGKLLFGKLNASLPVFDAGIYTDPISFEYDISGDFLANLSLPSGFVTVTDTSVSLGSNNDYPEILLNRKNWGLGIDAGIIYPISNRSTFSASILDFGFIGWRSNQQNYSTEAQYHYEGIWSDSVNVRTYIRDSINLVRSNVNYRTPLPIQLHLGLDYALNPKLNAQAIFSATYYPTKLLKHFSLALDYNPFRNFHIVTSYSLAYRAFNNIGLGFSAGRGPLQFYMVSDNVLGIIRPLSTRNINLRFGLNINIGCKTNDNNRTGAGPFGNGGNCAVYSSPLEKQKHRRKR